MQSKEELLQIKEYWSYLIYFTPGDSEALCRSFWQYGQSAPDLWLDIQVTYENENNPINEGWSYTSYPQGTWEGRSANFHWSILDEPWQPDGPYTMREIVLAEAIVEDEGWSLHYVVKEYGFFSKAEDVGACLPLLPVLGGLPLPILFFLLLPLQGAGATTVGRKRNIR